MLGSFRDLPGAVDMADAWRFQHHLGQQEKWTRSVVCEAKHELKL